MKSIYLSGKIGGLPIEEVKAKFSHAGHVVEAGGNKPVSPLSNGLPAEAEWHEHMLADLKMLSECDEIAMLPDWFLSPGAMIEKAFVERMGLTVLYL